MKAMSLSLTIALIAAPVLAQGPAPIHASIEKAAGTAARQTTRPAGDSASGANKKLFWPGLAMAVAGVTTSALGLTALRTEDSSTGNAPAGTYQACVAQKNSSPIYATNQCDALKGKNLKLLWGGVALSGVGAVLMISGLNTSAELSAGTIGLFHRWSF